MTRRPSQIRPRMPAEWERHAATWLTWPWPKGCSFPDNYDAVVPAYMALIRALVPHETVKINVWDADMESWVIELLTGCGVPLDNVEFHDNPAYEPWCRDHGPVFVTDTANASRSIINWGYNAWGEKYPPWDHDNAVPKRIAEKLHLPLIEPDMILEGGSIDSNGCGTLLTTESCLLNPNRNPTLSRDEIETRLRRHLGAENILWLGDGIAGDDTDGHIDDLARFVDPTTIVTIMESDPQDENHDALHDNRLRLRSMRDQQGDPFRIVELPMPTPIYWKDMRMPASYANFYIANGVVIFPTFNDSNDEPAQAILQSLFEDREVIGIDSTELIVGQGSFHCITQQEIV
ncbi:MAG: agmatine deiminase [Yoonia sp.]|jgi:agmatine deiminase